MAINFFADIFFCCETHKKKQHSFLNQMAAQQPKYNEEKPNDYEKGTYYPYRNDWTPEVRKIMTSFMDAVEASDHELVERLMRMHGEKIDLEARDSTFHSLVNMAVRRHDNKMVELLLDIGADIEWAGTKTHLRYKPLHYAIAINQLDTAQLLIDRGANVNAFSPDGQGNPIHSAACHGNLDAIRLLLNNGAIADTRAIEIAQEAKQLKAIDYLNAWRVLNNYSSSEEDEVDDD